jgi:hypothetical protein
MRTDRAEVFARTKIETKPETVTTTSNANLPDEIRQKVGGKDVETVHLEIQVSQSKRKPLHPEVIARLNAATALGVKALRDVPRLGAFQISDQNNKIYLEVAAGIAETKWRDTATNVARDIEAKGVGIAQVKKLGANLQADPAETWFRALNNASDIHQKRAIERAFSEWADGDSVAAHIAYGIDIFCSADVGNSNVQNSVLDTQHRAWLSSTYGVRFMTFEDLAACLT